MRPMSFRLACFAAALVALTGCAGGQSGSEDCISTAHCICPINAVAGVFSARVVAVAPDGKSAELELESIGGDPGTFAVGDAVSSRPFDPMDTGVVVADGRVVGFFSGEDAIVQAVVDDDGQVTCAWSPTFQMPVEDARAAMLREDCIAVLHEAGLQEGECDDTETFEGCTAAAGAGRPGALQTVLGALIAMCLGRIARRRLATRRARP